MVAVVAEIAGLKFKLDLNGLPSLRADLPLGFAVRESRLNGFNDVAQFFGNQSSGERCGLAGFAAKVAEHGIAEEGGENSSGE